MLQFNKSEATNTLAVYLDPNYTGSYDELILDFTQSYDLSTSVVEGTPLSTTNAYRNWLTFTVSGSEVPSPSGQYDVRIFEGTKEDDLKWNDAAVTWMTADVVWEEGSVLQRRTFLYEDRALVSGSNEVSITQYLSPNENGTYTTYNG